MRLVVAGACDAMGSGDMIDRVLAVLARDDVNTNVALACNAANVVVNVTCTESFCLSLVYGFP